MKKLNFGCGDDIREGWVNVDIQKAEGIDKSFDFETFPYPFDDNEFDYILLDNVLEHMKDIKPVLLELWRISKQDCIVEIIVPYYNSYYASADPTHFHYFNEYCMKQSLRIKPYDKQNQKELFEILELISVPQRFVKWIPLPILNIFKRIFGNIIIQIKAKAKVINKLDISGENDDE